MASMKTIHAPHLGHTIKLGGRKRPTEASKKAIRNQAKLSHYLSVALVAPPSTNYRASHDPALAQVFLNDALGDCVIAARYHRLGQLTSLAGATFSARSAQVLGDYERVGGYNPRDPNTDGGCDMVTNNNDAVTHGYADGSKDVGWCVIDGTNKELVKKAVFAFEGSVDLGIELPDAWISPFPERNGFVWDVAGQPNEQNGHCVQVIDYDETGVQIATWGLWGTITWAAMAKYLTKQAYGECYLHVSPDQVPRATAIAPNGIDWGNLMKDFAALGGTPPAPDPTPAPTPIPPIHPPVPAPPAPAPAQPTITLHEAQQLVRAAFKKVPQGMNRAVAERAVKVALAALEAGWF